MGLVISVLLLRLALSVAACRVSSTPVSAREHEAPGQVPTHALVSGIVVLVYEHVHDLEIHIGHDIEVLLEVHIGHDIEVLAAIAKIWETPTVLDECFATRLVSVDSDGATDTLTPELGLMLGINAESFGAVSARPLSK